MAESSMNDTYQIRYYLGGKLQQELPGDDPLFMIRHACDLVEDMDPTSEWKITVTCSNDEGEWQLLTLSNNLLPEQP